MIQNIILLKIHLKASQKLKFTFICHVRMAKGALVTPPTTVPSTCLSMKMLTLIFLFIPEVVCKTIEGKDCILPFTFKNTTFNKCITLEDPDDKPWCSTKVGRYFK